MTLATGSIAPDFTLDDQNGRAVRLSELLKSGPVVLYFYPRDDTPGCTAEACAFRDEFEAFQTTSASVVGVSSDSVASHASFASQHNLPFILLSDSEGRVRKLYDVKSRLGLLPGRVTFVIGPDGVIRHTFSSQVRMQAHVEEALRIIRGLAVQRP